MADYDTYGEVVTKHRTKRQRNLELYSPISQCYGKIKYSFNEAEKMARRITKDKNITFHKYFCTYCKHWHVGRE